MNKYKIIPLLPKTEITIIQNSDEPVSYYPTNYTLKRVVEFIIKKSDNELDNSAGD